MTRNRSLPSSAPRSLLPFLILPILLIAFGFSACNQASEPEEAAGPSLLLSHYELSGDTIFVHSLADTSRFCDGDVLVEEVDSSETDTSRHRLVGNRMWIASDFKARTPEGSPYTLRRHTGMRRLSGREGIEGWWRWDTSYNEVVAGALDAETQASQDKYLRASQAQLRYHEVDYGFLKGEFRMRRDGRMAELYLAEWNGEIMPDPDFPPDSAEYDVEVSILDRYSVRLTGRISGEVVTLTYDKTRMDTRYTSSVAGHLPYWSMEDPVVCPDGKWFFDFRIENGKGIGLPKRGTRRADHAAPFLVNPGFLGLQSLE